MKCTQKKKDLDNFVIYHSFDNTVTGTAHQHVFRPFSYPPEEY